MNREKLEKIKALAEDARGDPNLRRVAQQMYDKFMKELRSEHAAEPEFKDEIQRFVETGWGWSNNHNPYKKVRRDWGIFDVTIFKSRYRQGKFNWCIYYQGMPHFSARSFDSTEAAKRYAWYHLDAIREAWESEDDIE